MTTYRLEIDRSQCSGFGTCERLAPHLVLLDPDGLAAPRVAETDDPVVAELALGCPMGAITASRVERAA